MGSRPDSRNARGTGQPAGPVPLHSCGGDERQGFHVRDDRIGFARGGIPHRLYTSPHLVDARERIQIDGEQIPEAAWVAAYEQVHTAAERLLAREGIDAHPSFFETVTAMAFVAFAQAQVEIVVLEVGLGGRLDATNVITPEVDVITP